MQQFMRCQVRYESHPTLKVPECAEILGIGGKFRVPSVPARLRTTSSDDSSNSTVHNYIYISLTRYIYIH